MPLVTSRAVVDTKAAGDTWSAPFEYDGPGQHPLAKYFQGAAYDEMYRQGLWPSTAVNKLVGLNVLLPRKTYRKRAKGREEAPGSPLGQLMDRPSKRMNPVHFWGWFLAMYHIHGQAFARKVRDGVGPRGGRPVELQLIHPTKMRYGPEGGGFSTVTGAGVEEQGNRWWFCRSDGTEVPLARRDFIFLPRFNPASPAVGMSPFEPLRATLEADWAARTAERAMWSNGGKHHIVLKHPHKFNKKDVQDALAKQYQEKYGGVTQWGKPLVLEEGMDAIPLPVQADLAYVDTRKISANETAAAFDIPPPAIHILDQATFSNITAQFRSVYRVSMAPHLQAFEAMIEFDLRDGRFGDEGAPDFGSAWFFEWLVDGVLRGDWEARIDAYAKAIQTGQMTPAEVRRLENREEVDGSDTLLINAAVVPITEASRESAQAAQQASATLPDDGTLGDGLTSTRAMSLLMSGAIEEPAMATLMGRLSRPKSLAEVDVDGLVDGLDPGVADVVRATFTIARHAGSSVPELRAAIKRLRFTDDD